MPHTAPTAMAAGKATRNFTVTGGRSPAVRQLKVVLLGDTAVGKSSLAIRGVGKDFNQRQETTIGAAFFSHVIPVDGGTVKMSLWDTAGQEKYRALAPMYYRGTNAAIVVYDITNAGSFASAKRWVREMQETGGPSTFIALVGNKADLETTRIVQSEDALQYAENLGLYHMETSAKTGQNVSEIFEHIAQSAKGEPPTRNRQSTIRVGRNIIGGRGCCN